MKFSAKKQNFPGQKGQHSQPPAVSTVTGSLNPVRILHLEDDPTVARLVQEWLRRDGLEVEIERVDTMADFAERLATRSHALILSDFSIPGMDPFEALRLAHNCRPELPYVFFSGTLGEEAAVEALQQGAADYVLKDRPARLPSAVRRAMREAAQTPRPPQPQPVAEHAPLLADPTADPTPASAQRTWAKSPAIRYTAALLTVLAAAGVRAALDPYLHGLQPFTVFFAPVLIMGWWAGLGPAVFAAGLGGFIGDYFFSTPRYTFLLSASAQEWTTSIVYVVVSSTLIAITHHLRRGRERLRESQERFRLFMDHTPSLVWVKDERGRYVFLNKAYEQRFRLSLADCLGKTDDQLWDPETAVRLRQADRQALSAGQPIELTEQTTERDGRTSFWHNTKFCFHDHTGRSFVASLGLDLTERKLAEEKLRASEERLRKAISTPTVGVLFFCLDGRIHDANAAFERMSGYTAEELRFLDWKTLTLPDSWEVTARAAREMAEQGKTAPYEKQMVRKDGSRWWGLFAPVCLAGSGTDSECMEFIVDTSDRKQAEEALRRSEALYRTMARNIPDGAMSVVDRDLRYLTAEGELMARLGLSKESFEGCTVDQVFEGEVGRTRVEYFRRALAGETASYETDYHGRVVWSQFVPLRDERGEVFAAMSLALDITERKQAEQTLTRQALHLRLLHQAAAQLLLGQQPVDMLRGLYPPIAEAFGADAFMLYQEEPQNGRLHLRACAGMSEDEQRRLGRLRYGCAVCAEPGEVLRPIVATHLQTTQSPNRRFLRRLGFRSYLYYPLSLNNRLHGTLAFASRSRDDYGPADLEFFQTIARTLAEALERQRLEAELQHHAAGLGKTVQERTVKLRETIAELEGFSYSLVHDMRAPLRAMLSFAGILEAEAGPRLAPEDCNLLRKISIAAKRMDQLVTDSLNYSKILREDLPLCPVNLGALLRGMVETYPNLHKPEAEVAIDVGDLVVLGNEAALTQVFSNLLDNAVKFVAPGVHPRVRVWAQILSGVGEGSKGPQPSVRVFVEDNGIGIPQGASEKIFGMFQRLHRTHEYPGTGIGLALVKKSLERTGGRVSVESHPGHGSRFCIDLPSGNSPGDGLGA